MRHLFHSRFVVLSADSKLNVIYIEICLILGAFVGYSHETTPTLIPRIIGGQEASIEDFPSYVGLFLEYRGVFHIYCGGTYVQKLWILTAAHCICDVERMLMFDPKSLRVRMGIRYASDSGQERTPQDLIRHPEFQVTSKEVRNDIGIIKINRKFKLTDSVQMARIVAKYPFPREVIVVGYGVRTTTGLQAASPYLMKIRLRVKSFSQHFIECVDPTPRGACFGDSGGPMYLKDRRTLVGIVSHGDCHQGMGMYMNVFNYQKWIFTHVNDEDGAASLNSWNLFLMLIVACLVVL